MNTSFAAAIKLMAAFLAVSSSKASNPSPGLTFTALTNPLPLYPGEVSNTWHNIHIPVGPIAISEFAADVVEKDEDGNLIPVPLSEAYLHHHVVVDPSASDSDNLDDDALQNIAKNTNTRKKSHAVGFGSGTESRGTRQVFPHPFRFTTASGQDELLANVHVINTRGMTREDAHHCLECPCTHEDYATVDETQTSSTFPVLSEEVLSRRHRWDRCNAQLLDESNSACSRNLYYGGLLCCEHGEFCLDQYYLKPKKLLAVNETTHMRPPNPKIEETQSVFYLRYSLTYEPLVDENITEIAPLSLAACCDATGNLSSSGNVEYDIPQLCEEGGDCVHTLETTQYLNIGTNLVYGSGVKEDEFVDVVFAVGHLHRGGMEISAYVVDDDDENEEGTLLCQSFPQYGNGEVGEIGNEPGYINSMSTCTFDPPLRMKASDKIRVVGKYNASQAHTGVMSLFYIAIAEIDDSVESSAEMPVNFLVRYRVFIGVGAVVVAVLVMLSLKNRQSRRQGYEEVGNGEP